MLTLQVCNSVGFSMYIHTAARPSPPLPACFSHPKGNLEPPNYPLCKPLRTTNLFSVAMDLPILGILHTWNYTVCDFFHLA